MADGRRLPFTFAAHAGVGQLVLADEPVGPLHVARLELEVADLGTDPGSIPAERFQRRRTRLRSIAIRAAAAALAMRVADIRKHLAGLGITQVGARLCDNFISVRARAADGLAAADVSFRVILASAGINLRALASAVRVHGHVPTPGPVIADRILGALFGATETAGVIERPHTRGLCDVEVDLIGALLWALMPPSGWRLPAVGDLELVNVKIARGGIDIGFGPAGSRSGASASASDPGGGGVHPHAVRLAAAHDLMHSADQQLREGHLEDAMRGYRGLLAAGGPDQPLLLERILALAAARPAWFFDGLELSRQALSRWPSFPPAHAALASITLAQGDAREAASHLGQLAHLASGDGDDDQAALAALAGARLLRVLEPKAATQLYQLALDHDPASAEAADALADRYADEHRWPELVRLLRARAAASETARAVQLRLRLADVLVHHADNPDAARAELATARELAPDDPAVHEMAASLLQATDASAAIAAWREVARLADARGDRRTAGRAHATVGNLVAGSDGAVAETAWRTALALDAMQADALTGLASAAARRGEHAAAAELYERLRGLGLPQQVAGRSELELARSLVALGRTDDARGSLRRATLAGGEIAAEAHALLAEVAQATADPEHAVAELDTAIGSLVDLAAASTHIVADDRLRVRAAELAVARATLMDRSGQIALATADWERAHELAQSRAPGIARDAARTLLARTQNDAATERRWIDAVLATRPPPEERAPLLVQRADARRREATPDSPTDIGAAIADLHEALALVESGASASSDAAEAAGVAAAVPAITAGAATELRRRAYRLEAELLARSGDRRARAQALTALANIAERTAERVEVDTAAAAAWLAADDPAAALPHGARAHASIEAEPDASDIPPALRRNVLVMLGEAAWRQRVWADVLRAYRGLIDDPGAEAPQLATFRYRLAVAAGRTGDAELAMTSLAPVVAEAVLERERHADAIGQSYETPDATPQGMAAEVLGQALRLYADLAERAGDLGASARALDAFATLATSAAASARADAMYRAGELFRRAGDREAAIRCLEAALKISETHLPALDALELAWRERGDLERVSVILGRKVAATTRHPTRQKPLLSRLGDLQDHLGRPDVALAAHQRALEIDPQWRPSLRYVTTRLRDDGQSIAAAGGFAQLAGELPGDAGADTASLAHDREDAGNALAAIAMQLDDAELDAVREVALPALERAIVINPRVAPALARVRGDAPLATQAAPTSEEDTQSGRASAAVAVQGAQALREAAARASAAGKPGDAFASLEAANHVAPGDAEVLRELVERATELGDHEAAARHCAALADTLAGARRGDVLLELADICYEHLGDAPRARGAMHAAADAFATGPGGGLRRREATLRVLANEAAAHLAWDVAVSALEAIGVERLGKSDVGQLAAALVRAGRPDDAVRLVGDAILAGRYDDGDVLLGQLRGEVARRAELDEAERVASVAGLVDAEATLEREPVAGAVELDVDTEADAPPAEVVEPEAVELQTAEPRAVEPQAAELHAAEPQAAEPQAAEPQAAEPQAAEPQAAEPQADGRHERPAAAADVAQLWRSVGRAVTTDSIRVIDTTQLDIPIPPVAITGDPIDLPSVTITGTPADTERAVNAAAAAADRDRLLDAHRTQPSDVAVLMALLAHLGNREPALRRDALETSAREGSGRARAMALHELASAARTRDLDPVRASAMWSEAFRVDPSYAPVWMPLADALAAADDLEGARELYERVSESPEYDDARRAWAAERADVLGHDDSIVSGEIPISKLTGTPAGAELDHANALAVAGDWTAAIGAAERAAETAARIGSGGTTEREALELLERLYLEVGDITAASEAIGRQLVLTGEEPEGRAALWRRRAKLYRDALGREAEAYRCLKEAHAASPADPEVAYQLRTAAMVRGEHALAASLLYREIAASTNPRDRGALHLELALIYDERLADANQARVNYEQALAFDPTIPAAKLPLARRYEAMARHGDAARLYEAAAAEARPAERAGLLAAAERCRAGGGASEGNAAAIVEDSVAVQLERADVAGDLDAAQALAEQLWVEQPGHALAFRVLASAKRASADLAGLHELTTVRVAKTDVAEDRASAWLDVARLAEELGQLDQAARAYDHALIEDPGHAAALDARGALAFRIGDLATADMIYRDLGPGESVLGDDELANRRSVIAERLGRGDEALGLAQLAATAAPGRRELWSRVTELATRSGDLAWALDAERRVLDLVPLDDDAAQLSVGFELVELLRLAGDLDGAANQLERILRDFPHHARAIETLADVHVARGDWPAATRFLYMLVPLAPTPRERADRLYRLGEAVLVHLGDVDRADDVFLRASDLDPGHVPTLRRLLDVYWRADDPAAIVEVASELATAGALANGAALSGSSLAHALVAAALVGDTKLAAVVQSALGEAAATHIAAALADLKDRDGRLALGSATVAVAELGRRGIVDLASLRAAAADSPVAAALR